MQNASRKLHDAISDLERCSKAYVPSSEKERSITFIALTKAFEVALEYAWKELKRIIEDRGLEAFSPKDVVREAATIGLIKKPKLWIDAINMRNLSVHDYFSLPEGDTADLINEFLKEIKKVF